MNLKIYEYKNCGTCKKALKFLGENKISYEKFPIRETPPSLSDIQKMLKYLDGDLKKLFNTSGLDYKAMNMKEKLPKLSEEAALKLLSQNGNLIKRPFVLANNDGWVGFQEEVWKKKVKVVS